MNRNYQTAIALGLLLCMSCSSRTPSTAKQAVAAAPKIRATPVEITLTQRSTVVVPRSGGAVRLTIDDITGGQVMASLAGDHGTDLLASTSMAAGDSIPFRLGDRRYKLTLSKLDNQLVGDDHATFVLDALGGDADAATGPDNETDSELTEIENLIKHVESLPGAVFIRNGEVHSPEEAAQHLRAKWQSQGDAIVTAEQFIDELASKSSSSGEPYHIRFADGSERAAGEYLHEVLKGKAEAP